MRTRYSKSKTVVTRAARERFLFGTFGAAAQYCRRFARDTAFMIRHTVLPPDAGPEVREYRENLAKSIEPHRRFADFLDAHADELARNPAGQRMREAIDLQQEILDLGYEVLDARDRAALEMTPVAGVG